MCFLNLAISNSFMKQAFRSIISMMDRMCLKFVDVQVSADNEPLSLKNLVIRMPAVSKMDASTFDALCFNIPPLPVLPALQYDDSYTYLHVSQ